LSCSFNVVIVGNGVSGVTAARTIKEKNPNTNVSIYTDENSNYYPRPRLYEILSGKSDPENIIVFSEEWYKKQGITVHLEKKAVMIDTEQKKLILDDLTEVSYDKLVLANGAHCFVPPIKGSEKKGIFTLRNIKDAKTIREYAKNTKKAIIIGGGLLGLEFAFSLRKLGQKVTVIELSQRLLPRQLDNDGATILKERIEALDIKIVLGAKTAEILGKEKVSGIKLESNETIQGDLVLISAGIRSNIELANKSGINVNRGVIVDNHLKTSAENIYAIGDIAEFNGTVYGIIPAAVEQAKNAAANIQGKQTNYRGTVPTNTLKVMGIDLTSVGLVNPEDTKYEKIKETDKKKGIYKKLVLDKGKIVGAIILGETKLVQSIKRLIVQETDITKYKNLILKNNFDYKRITA
jgi:nitrite reductase (NADH) large subunit